MWTNSQWAFYVYKISMSGPNKLVIQYTKLEELNSKSYYCKRYYAIFTPIIVERTTVNITSVIISPVNVASFTSQNYYKVTLMFNLIYRRDIWLLDG